MKSYVIVGLMTSVLLTTGCNQKEQAKEPATAKEPEVEKAPEKKP